MKKQSCSPEELVELAAGEGFGLEGAYHGTPQGWGITFLKRIPGGGTEFDTKEVFGIYNAISRILGKAKVGWARWGEEGEVSSSHANRGSYLVRNEAGVITGRDVWARINQLDEGYVRGVEIAAAQIRDSLSHQADLNFKFDEKVSDEVDGDATVGQIKAELYLVKLRESELERELALRREMVRAEREGAREPFLFVTGGREI